MRIKMRKSTELEKDIIGFLQGYIGLIYLTGAMMFKEWGWSI